MSLTGTQFIRSKCLQHDAKKAYITAKKKKKKQKGKLKEASKGFFKRIQFQNMKPNL